MTPLGGLTPLKLMVYSRPLTRHQINFHFTKVVPLSKQSSIAKFYVQGRRHDAYRGAKNPEIEAYISVNIHFTATFA